MNKRIDYTQPDGLGVSQDTLNFMQTSYRDALSAIGRAFGNNTILYGCEVNGSNVSDGWVYIDGEMMPFIGGVFNPRVLVDEVVDVEQFSDLSTKTVYYTKVARSVALGGIPFSDLRSLKTIQAMQLSLVPANGIMIWWGEPENPPTGWAYCNGQNGTPDMRSIFPVGFDVRDADYNIVGKKGGLKTVSLTAAQNGLHDHTTHGKGSILGNFLNRLLNNRYSQGGGADSFGGGSSPDNTMRTGDSGTGQAHENRPPYMAVVFIMKLQ
jgi:microcystin-dependent protein